MNWWEELAVSIVVAFLHRFSAKPSTDAKVTKAVAEIRAAVDAVASAEGQ